VQAFNEVLLRTQEQAKIFLKVLQIQ
jgi:hypothetical protein